MKFTAYFLSALIMLVWSCTSKSDKSIESATSIEVVTANSEILDVASLLAKGENYHEKVVTLQGTVVHVCKHSGKRLHLMSKDEKTKIRIEAGAIGKFERELEGSDILVKGTFMQEVIDETNHSEACENSGEDHVHEGAETHEHKEQGNNASAIASGKMRNSWVEGISFEIVDAGEAI